MNFRVIWEQYRKKLMGIRPFLRTKVGSRLALLAIADFIALFFAPALHGFVGAAIFGCVASVYLILVWRRFDNEHAIVPAVILCVPMLLDMLIYSIVYAGDSNAVTAVIVAFVVAIPAMFIAALGRLVGFLYRITDAMYFYIAAGAVCVAVVVAAWILDIIVLISWWILCIIAFLAVAGIFLGVVFSTAAYTASDGRRQARKHAEEEREEFQQKRYSEFRPRERDTKVYNLDDDDFIDIDDYTNP